jgi:hypothetical protein
MGRLALARRVHVYEQTVLGLRVGNRIYAIGDTDRSMLQQYVSVDYCDLSRNGCPHREGVLYLFRVWRILGSGKAQVSYRSGGKSHTEPLGYPGERLSSIRCISQVNHRRSGRYRAVEREDENPGR